MNGLIIALSLLAFLQPAEPRITETEEQIIIELSEEPASSPGQGSAGDKATGPKTRETPAAGTQPEESKSPQQAEQAERVQFKRQNMRNDLLQKKEIRMKNIQGQ